MCAAPLDDLVGRLPHHPPMRLVEHVVELVPGQFARTTRIAHPDDWYFQGHFPNHPVIPAIALVELIAQTGGLAAAGEVGEASLRLRVAAFTNFKFPAAAGPGSLLESTAHVVARFGTLVRIEGSVTADSRLVASGSVTLAEVSTADIDL
jgi:3-hydroxymyristoyl/3-hydroxydecanoyl-(acyl carrier protein) dehydratase